MGDAPLTQRKVERDFRDRLLASPLAREISGEVYYRGTVPRDKRGEYATVMFTAGHPGQIESGTVTVNVYVPDIDPCDNGVFMEDMARTEILEELASEWAVALEVEDPDYLVSLADSVHTTAEPETDRHFIVVRLNYRYLNERQ